MTDAEDKILEVAKAIKAGKRIYFRENRRCCGHGLASLRFLDIDFVIVDQEKEREIIYLPPP